MASDWKIPEPPLKRKPLEPSDRSINYEAAAFTQMEKLLFRFYIYAFIT